MKKLYTFGLCLLLCLFLPNLIKADTLEIAGADISYKWLSGNTYQVNLNIYTKCNYTSLDSVWIKVSSPDANFKSYRKLANLKDEGELQIDCHNHEHWSSCDDPALTLPGIRKWSATAEFTLSGKDYCRYFFSWDTCCRTKIITTGPGSNHFYIDAYMRICEDSISSSPYFSEDPYIKAGVNHCNKKQNPVANANDANSRYEFMITSPKQSANTNVSYGTFYNFRAPFLLSDSNAVLCSPLKINDSGEVTFHAKTEDISPLAFNLSRSDKNGVLQSRINRDIIYELIHGSSNQAPIISGINGGRETRVYFHGAQSKCFTINTFDIDENDSVFVEAFDIPKDATFKIEKDKRFPKGTFCWLTKVEDIRKEPYVFTVKAKDSNYPCGDLSFQGITEKTFEIYVCPDHDCSQVGLNETDSKAIKLYPQPAQNAVYVELPENRIRSLQISDMAGRIFLPDYIWENNLLKIDINAMSNGNYILKISTDKTVYNSKLIISK